jgi:hypothetical protein
VYSPHRPHGVAGPLDGTAEVAARRAVDEGATAPAAHDVMARVIAALARLGWVSDVRTPT